MLRSLVSSWCISPCKAKKVKSTLHMHAHIVKLWCNNNQRQGYILMISILIHFQNYHILYFILTLLPTLISLLFFIIIWIGRGRKLKAWKEPLSGRMIALHQCIAKIGYIPCKTVSPTHLHKVFPSKDLAKSTQSFS